MTPTFLNFFFNYVIAAFMVSLFLTKFGDTQIGKAAHFIFVPTA